MTESDKNMLLLQWIKCILNKETISDVLRRKGFVKVAICGYRECGHLLVTQLIEEGMNISCIVDRNYQALRELEDKQIPIVGFEECMRYNPDVMIVTPDMDYGQVCEYIELAEIDILLLKMESLLFD